MLVASEMMACDLENEPRSAVVGHTTSRPPVVVAMIIGPRRVADSQRILPLKMASAFSDSIVGGSASASTATVDAEVSDGGSSSVILPAGYLHTDSAILRR